ncbi:uncharacterized protein BDR25DRAFT_203200, partial [Lindgomyces ingoldianus]
FNASTLPKKNVSGTYNIAGTYCVLANKMPEREGSIQLLLHGLAYTKEYWNGIKYPNTTFPGEFSWVHHATAQGYSTLAIDNLGNGDSDFPDPINTVQLPLQLEVIREIIKGLRSQSFSCIQAKYNKVIFVTHSYGSLVGRAMAQDYPNPADGADAYILTASSTNLVGIKAAGANFRPRAASIQNPKRFGHLPPAYVHMDPTALREIVYSLKGEYDPGMLAWDMMQPHSFAIGELATFKKNDTSEFAGPVMYLTGRIDAIVCDAAGNTTISIPNCGVRRSSNPGLSVERFPRAKPFGVYVPDQTGHNLNLGYSAPETFGAVNQFL